MLLCGHMVVTGVGVRRPRGNTGTEEVSPPWLGSWCGERNEKQRGEGKSREGIGPPQASRSVLLPLEFLHPPGLPARRPDTLRTTRRHHTCHSVATRPPADSTRVPSLMARGRVSACFCWRPQATPSLLLHNSGPSPPTSSAVLQVPPPSRHGGVTSAHTAPLQENTVPHTLHPKLKHCHPPPKPQEIKNNIK